MLPVESRMLNAIAKVTSASAMRLEDLSPSRPRNWADTTLADRADAVGLGDAYLGSFGGRIGSGARQLDGLARISLRYKS